MNIWIYKFKEDDMLFYDKMTSKLPKKVVNHCIDYQEFKSRFLSILGYFLAIYFFKIQSEPNKSIDICWNKYGKPYLKAQKGFYFNFSHSNEFLAFIYGSSNLGIDIESKTPDSFKILNNIKFDFLTPNEITLLNKNISNDVLLMKYWTIKESIIKLIGKGFQISLKDIVIDWADSNYSSGIGLLSKNRIYNFNSFDNKIDDFVLSISSKSKQNFFNLKIIVLNNFFKDVF
jgi:phosphopantetheinyl transferase